MRVYVGSRLRFSGEDGLRDQEEELCGARAEEVAAGSTHGNGNRKGKGAIDIDIRNDKSVACLPGSIYQIHPRDREKKKDKL